MATATEEARAGFTWDLMNTFGMDYDKLSYQELVIFATGLRRGESRALEAVNPDYLLSEGESMMHTLTNLLIQYVYLDTGQTKKPRLISLPSEVEDDMAREREEREARDEAAEFLEILRLQQLELEKQEQGVERDG